MANGQWAVVLRHVHRLFQGESVSSLSEGQLLERFAETRDEVAFGAILARHGPMVLGVCRGVLNDPHDVDDAFQATFLILVKKAGALRDGDLLAQWLYGVARRVALRARSDATRRKARERPEAEVAAEPLATLDGELRELQTLIREEVDRLSHNDRMAVVLCYLEGLTHEEAADRLGWPVGTVKGRLSRARDKLKGRLTRRGVALPTVAIASTLANGASAAVPSALIRSTTLAAIQLVSGKSLTAGIVSVHAITLMEGVIGTMFTTKLKIGVAALVATCVMAVPGVLAFQGPASEGPDKTQAPNPKQAVNDPAPSDLRSAKEVPSPDPSQADMARLAEEALAILEKMVATVAAPNSLKETSAWARRLVEAQAGPTSPPSGRIAALQAYRDRMRKQVDAAQRLAREGGLTAVDVLEARYALAEAERWLQEGRVGVPAGVPPIDAAFGMGGGGGPPRKPLVIKTMPGDEKRNQAILAKLEENLSMNFASDTPIEDVKKYIEQSTQDEAAGLPNGIPIYVDPAGLQEADKTMASTVAIQLEGIPLRTTLRLLLHQLDLAYRVEGGLLLITNEGEIPDALSPNPGGLRRSEGGFR